MKAGYARYHFLSALTLLQYNEYESRHATYTEISQAIATYCVAEHVKEFQAELFGRMVFNILVHNNDDHLRNHGFIYDAEKQGWRLSPLYDVLPAPSGSHERFLHLGVGSEGRSATLTNAMTKHGAFGLHRAQAIEIIERISSIVREWKGYFEDAGVPGKDIDAVSSAFRRPRDIGLDSLS